MHPADIKALLAKSGHSQIDVATRQLHVSPAAVSRVIAGELKAQRIAQHIATLVGLQVHELWPDLYPAPKRVRRAATKAVNA